MGDETVPTVGISIGTLACRFFVEFEFVARRASVILRTWSESAFERSARALFERSAPSQAAQSRFSPTPSLRQQTDCAYCADCAEWRQPQQQLWQRQQQQQHAAGHS